MEPILEQIYRVGVIPVIAIDDAKKAVPLARALVAGGLPAAEVTFRTAAAQEAMEAITAQVPEMLVGAGTVLTCEQVDRALSAGAKFIVSPGFNPDTVRYVQSKGALMLPGTATPGEMEQAMSLGLEAVKFFPAEQNGGVAKLRAVAGPYQSLKWMPTGGVNAKNLMDYLSFDQILACGGTWMVNKALIEGEQWDEIPRLTRQAVDIMLGLRLDHVGIHCAEAQEAERTAKAICALLGFPYRAEASSDYAGSAVECTKGPGPGGHGHIAIAANNLDRAIYHLGLRGVELDGHTLETDSRGRAKSIYAAGTFGGFAIQLVQK